MRRGETGLKNISGIWYLLVCQKSPDLIENLKIPADSILLFWAIQPKRKREIDGISGKDQF